MWAFHPLTALALAATVALFALRVGWLSLSGAVAAGCVGWLTLGIGGWAATIVLMAFFLSGSLLTRWRAAEKRRMQQLTAQGLQRNAFQVVANGGVATACLVGFALTGDQGWWLGFSGAYAAATSDTWSSEVGALSRRPPRHLLSGRLLQPGESGGVSWMGTLAGLGGSAAIALISLWTLSLPIVQAIAVVLSGIAGNLTDSLLGATLQGRYRCAVCGQVTETPLHCDQPAHLVSGWRWVNNDLVNLCATAIGALLASVSLLYP